LSTFSSWGGPITVNTQASFACSGTLRLTGPIGGPGGVTIGVPPADGTIEFAGSEANTYLGPTFVNHGILLLNKQAADGAIPGRLTIGGTSTFDPTTVRLLRSGQIAAAGEVTVAGNAILDLNGFSDLIGPLTLIGGTVETGDGLLTLGGDLTTFGSTRTAIIDGHLSLGSLGGNRILSIQESAVTPALSLVADVSGIRGMTKTGDGELLLAGANSYLGGTIINGGRVSVVSSTGLGSPQGGTILNDATLAIARSMTNESLTINDASARIETDLPTTWAGDIVMNADLHVSVLGGFFDITGSIAGTGKVVKEGPGLMRFSGPTPNDFTGETFVNAGTLELGKPVGGALGGRVHVGDGVGVDTLRNLADSQVGRITVNGSGLWDLNGFDDNVAGIALNDGGDIATGSGILLVSSGITVTPEPRNENRSIISGRMDVLDGEKAFFVSHASDSTTDLPDLLISAAIRGSATIRKSFDGVLALTGTNTFTGLVNVVAGELRISNAAALGATDNGTTVLAPGKLSLAAGISVLNEELVLRSPDSLSHATLQNSFGSNTWFGPIVLENDSHIDVTLLGTLDVRGAISGPGSLVKTGRGPLFLSGGQSNTYRGTTRVNEGVLVLAKTGPQTAINGDLVMGDDLGDAESVVVRAANPNQFNALAGVVIGSSGLLDVRGGSVGQSVGSLSGAGAVELADLTLLRIGANNADTTFDGIIRGPGLLRKVGTGTLTLNGVDSYTGFTTVDAGTLAVNGWHRNSQVTVKSGATLAGNGTLDAVVAETGSRVSPGNSPGRLVVSDLNLQPGSTYVVELDGPPLADRFDSLFAIGPANLTGADLDVSVNYVTAEGDSFEVLRKDGSEPVTGTFNGLPEGGLRDVGSRQFVISYQGGDGNDVVLTATNTTLNAVEAIVQGGDGDGRFDPNECNLLYLAISNRFDEPVTGLHAVLDTFDSGVAVTAAESGYPDLVPHGAAVNLRPFQVSALANLQCGQPVRLRLTLTTASHGTLAVMFDLPSGPACTDGGGRCESCVPTIAGTLFPDGPRLTQILDSRTSPGQCGSSNSCSTPREVSAPGLLYHTHPFTNDGPGTCVTVLLTPVCPNSNGTLYAAAYLDTFEPSDVCSNHLGEVGHSGERPGPYAFSFAVPAGARFVVVVNERPVEGGNGGIACPDYTLELFGLPCPPPKLRIAPTAQPDEVRLQWSTSAAGFQLESVLEVSGAVEFSPVPTTPVVVDGQFTVTNSMPNGREFFRLNKP
jgi:autotransporter-associated beta strand protein